jgi:hypothetical protein
VRGGGTQRLSWNADNFFVYNFDVISRMRSVVAGTPALAVICLENCTVITPCAADLLNYGQRTATQHFKIRQRVVLAAHGARTLLSCTVRFEPQELEAGRVRGLTITAGLFIPVGFHTWTTCCSHTLTHLAKHFAHCKQLTQLQRQWQPGCSATPACAPLPAPA